MNRNRAAIAGRRLVCGGLAQRGSVHRAFYAAALWAGLVQGVHAQSSALLVDEPQTWPEAETVRTLLRADAATALADCRVPGICQAGVGPGFAPPPHAASAAMARPSDEIRVLAIFGVARSLRADLNINGAVMRYQAGRGTPIAGSAVMGAYQLLAIEDACVRLRRDDLERIACLDVGRAYP